MTEFSIVLEDLMFDLKFQHTPIPFSEEDYIKFLITGIKSMYVDLGEDAKYSLDFDDNNLVFSVTYSHVAQEYILNGSKIAFYKLVQQTVNDIVGYSTNSLKVTNADKPYANISNEVNSLKDRQIELFYKLSAGGVYLEN